jgi:hypothetical protein
MRMRGLVLATMFTATGLSMALAQAPPKLALNAEKPIVYIEFDHAGPRTPVQEGEPAKGLWLRLVNNSTIPIVVQANGTSTDPNMTILPDTIIAVKGRIPKSGPVKRAIPSGYASDTGTPLTIEPGKSLVFSVPSNHVSPTWSMQVPFQFSLPAVKEGVQPVCLAEFTWGDIPSSSEGSLGHEATGHAKGVTAP